MILHPQGYIARGHRGRYLAVKPRRPGLVCAATMGHWWWEADPYYATPFARKDELQAWLKARYRHPFVISLDPSYETLGRRPLHVA